MTKLAETLNKRRGALSGLAAPIGCARRAHFVRMFKPRFADLVETGRKLQTVRPEPKRMPKPGDTISLRCWSGLPYRSKQRVLREGEIREVHHTLIDEDGVNLYERDAAWAPDRDAFARADGFADWPDMRRWFEETHGLPFRGIVLYWHNMRVEARGQQTKE